MFDAPKIFLDELAKDHAAKERFDAMTNLEKKLVMDEARQISDPEAMRAHVSSIRM